MKKTWWRVTCVISQVRALRVEHVVTRNSSFFTVVLFHGEEKDETSDSEFDNLLQRQQYRDQPDLLQMLPLSSSCCWCRFCITLYCALTLNWQHKLRYFSSSTTTVCKKYRGLVVLLTCKAMHVVSPNNLKSPLQTYMSSRSLRSQSTDLLAPQIAMWNERPVNIEWPPHSYHSDHHKRLDFFNVHITCIDWRLWGYINKKYYFDCYSSPIESVL